MTNEQAITKLTNVLNDDIYSWSPAILTAFNMAVDALRGADGDYISRQAAIDRAVPLEIFGKTVMIVAVSEIERLPSAQPVITCDGCRFVGTYDTDFPCRNCLRKERDYYEPER